MTENNPLNPEQDFRLTRGVPGSGKSTYAKQWVIAAPNRVRVNRDDIRQELHEQKHDYKAGTYYEPTLKDEERTTVIAHRRINDALTASKSVLVDDTNLNLRYYKAYHQIAATHGLVLGHKDFPITLDEAKRRNSLREQPVPDFVIDRMYSNLGPNGEFHHWDGDYTPRAFVKPAEKLTGIIVDLDGTAVDVRPIRHFVRGKYRNFDMFHRSSLFCAPNPEVIEMVVDAHNNGFAIIVVSARVERYREVSEVWLNQHLPVPFSNMYLRPEDDNRPDFEVKHDILKKIREDYSVAVAIDDNPFVRQNWTENGIRTVIVPGFEEGSVTEDEVLHIDNSFRMGCCLRCGKPLKSGAAIGPVCAKFS
jgi:predicted kinase